ncbi:hypothetical protein [Aquabacter cavernae]|uniref:hypothetical protein n=1 Tax=Aquabacter cavernae TaxID=2496029 RepID=UPI000F8D1AFD|nr:hypothetical protein [Aquabacter cavernae]
MSRGSATKPGPGAADFASYVAALAAELSRMAREHRLGTLAYLLDVTRMEARSLSETTGEPDTPLS